MSVRPGRIALLAPYWEFWESSSPLDLRARLAGLLAEAAAVLDSHAVVASETLLSAEDVPRVADALRAARPDAIVVVQTMAVPPGRAAAALDTLPHTPLVVWALHPGDGPGDDYGHADVTADGATVGTSQLVNVLVRRGRRPGVVVGRLHDPATHARLDAEVAGAAVAGQLTRARVARVGEPQPGYDCVTCDVGELGAALGTTVVDVAPADVAERFHAADERTVAMLASEVEHDFSLDRALDPDDEGLRRSLRFAAAMEALDDELALDAGAMNCHVEALRFAPAIGVTPCFALGRETSRGRPWTCAGDILTAVALLTTKRLGAPSLYHELETIDYRSDELVIANTGEHDSGWTGGEVRAQLGRNDWFAGDPLCGACASFTLPAGPATLVAFTPHPAAAGGFRYVVAEGETTGRGFVCAGTPNGAFRFADVGAAEGFRAWALAGANHHSSVAPGHLGDAVAAVAGHLGIGCVRVGGPATTTPSTAKDQA